MNNDNIAISFNNVSFSYKLRSGIFSWKQRVIFQNLSFSINKGDIVGFYAKNGAGKSTLLKLIHGTLLPDNGTIHKSIDSYLAEIGSGYLLNLSGYENSIIKFMYSGNNFEDAKLLTEKVKKFSELKDQFYEPVNTYSSGMRSRLGFSISLFSNHSLLLLDEIHSVGDSAFKIKSKNALLQKINEITCIIVSHDLFMLKDQCDVVYTISNRKINPC